MDPYLGIALVITTTFIALLIVAFKGYWAIMYVTSLEGEDMAAQHQIAARALGWKFRNQPYGGVPNQTSHPRSDRGIM